MKALWKATDLGVALNCLFAFALFLSAGLTDLSETSVAQAVTGRLVGPMGSPLPGAELIAFDPGQLSDERRFLTSTFASTDADGRFFFDPGFEGWMIARLLPKRLGAAEILTHSAGSGICSRL